jgi:hypothetical protein
VHYLIGILTEGDTRHQARAHAVAFADELVTRGEFDYYDKLRARTYTLASALGKKAVEGALAANRREFDAALHTVKLMLQVFTDEQIYQDDYPPEPREYYASRYEFTQVGDGHRVAQAVSGGATTYYLGDLEELTGGTLTKYYALPAGLPGAMEVGSTITDLSITC